jgi:phage shock protein A
MFQETTTVAAPNVGETLTRLRAVRDEMEGLNSELSKLESEKSQLEAALMHAHEEQGVDSFKGGGLTVSFAQAFRAKYEPEKWTSIVKWAVETGNEHLIQRRLTDTKVVELVDGGIALPDGLNLEGYTKISVRRVG